MGKFLDFIINGIKRFKISSIYIFVIFILLITLSITDTYELVGDENIQRLVKIGICLGIGFLISFGLEIFYEKEEKLKKSFFKILKGGSNSEKNYYIFQLMNIVYLLIFYRFLDLKDYLFPILNYVIFIGFLFFIPFLKLKNDLEKYYNFIYNIFLSIFKSLIFSLIILIGGYIGLFAITELFDFGQEITEIIFSVWLAFSYTLCFLGIILCDLKKIDELYENIEFDKFINLILKNLLTGFICLYFLILYAYSIKALINIENRTTGIIPWLIICFSVIGYAGYVFTKKYEEESKFIKYFRLILPIGILIQTLLLFYAIFVRIYEYSLTVNRYFVLVFGIFLFSISLYFIISKRKNIVIIPGLISIIALIISVGPWGIRDLPNIMQYNGLIKNLEINGLYIDGKVKQNKGYKNEKINDQIISQITYLCNNGECDKIKELFSFYLNKKDFEADEFEYLTNIRSTRKIISAIEKRLLKNKEDENTNNNQNNIKLDTRIWFTTENFPLNENVEGYKKIIGLNHINNMVNVGLVDYQKIWDNEFIINIYGDHGIIDTVDLTDYINSLIEKYCLEEYTTYDEYMMYKYDECRQKNNFGLDWNGNFILNDEDLTFENEKYKIIFKDLEINNGYQGSSSPDEDKTYGYILIK